ncbi:MAG: inositol monophosphatase family protein, partial [Rhodospirillaceae bacterium]
MTRRIRTSETDPLRIDSMEIPGGGSIGLTICPGKHDASGSGPDWRRDLGADLDAVVAWGADAIVCLLSQVELEHLSVPTLPAEAERRRLGFIPLPMVEGGIPDEAFESAWKSVGPRLRALLGMGGRVLVHCRGGLGRSGLVAARLLIEMGTEPDNAIVAVRRARPGAIETSLQEKYVRSCRAVAAVPAAPLVPRVPDMQAVLALAEDAAKEAGSWLREEFHREGGPRGHGGHAEVDTRVERLLKGKLREVDSWNWLGEETDSIRVAGCPHVWVVDPHDGTSAFLEGRRGTAVSIALLTDGIPVLGVVYAFGWPDDRGDLISWAAGCGPVRRNGVPTVDITDRKLVKGDVVAVSHVAEAKATPRNCRITQGVLRAP